MRPKTLSERFIWFCLSNKLIVLLVVAIILLLACIYAPFDWKFSRLVRDPINTDAIPYIGENQQVVFTKWEGRSPQDVENQITYPLTTSLLGLPKVKAVRSSSMFGFSIIFVIFEDDAEFYWTRSRIIEKIASISENLLPEGVKPMLGPDATALGQVFWYTLEGRDEEDKPTGGWGLNELRSIQDWNIRYALQSVEGVSEVASVGGYVNEYQIDADPEAMRIHGITIEDLYRAVSESNLDIGARSIEINKVEYVIRSIGFVKSPEDIAESVLKTVGGTPLRVKHVANVTLGPAYREGALDKGGAETIGGVVIVRYGANPLKTIENVKTEIDRISPSLPSKVIIDYSLVSREEVAKFASSIGFDAYTKENELNQSKWVSEIKKISKEKRPSWLKLSQVKIVPFYDRTKLIHETLGTLENALKQQSLITMIVIITMLAHLRSGLLISLLMPLAVAMCFIFMKIFEVEANLVSLGGIAIAIGSVVDMGIVICENILKNLEKADASEDKLKIIYHASIEESGSVLTAVATTVISFLTVFALEGAEGKLFRPLAYTYIFVLAASLIIAIAIVPTGTYLLIARTRLRIFKNFGFLLKIFSWLFLVPLIIWLALHWRPLGFQKSVLANLVCTFSIVTFFLGIFLVFRYLYPKFLASALRHKILFAIIPLSIYLWGLVSWLGFGKVFFWLPSYLKETKIFTSAYHLFPGLGKEFMPSLDEGSFLFMPTTMPHAGIGEALDILQKQDILISSIPEVESVVGKLGRADTALDPAPKEMFETIINYKNQYVSDKNGNPITFKFISEENDLFRDERGNSVPAPDGLPYIVKGRFERDANGKLIPDKQGMPFRLWRPTLNPALNPGRKAWKGIQTPDDIWNEIVKVTEMPGVTSAPRLQPIAARIVMLQSGMRAAMGLKIKGHSLEDIEQTGLQIEKHLKDIPSVEPTTVFADRIIGKPYLEINLDRQAVARYGISISKIQDTLDIAVGGRKISSSVEGREKYPIRIRYKRELRDSPEEITKLLITSEDGTQIPLSQIAEIKFVCGPQEIKSENGFLIGYVLFDKKPGKAEVDVVNECKKYLEEKISLGELNLPPGVSFQFAGSYESQVRSEKKLMIILPLSLLLIFIILYLQFREIPIAFLVFIDIASSWAAGLIMLWLSGQTWFLNFDILGIDMRELFQIQPMNLSVAVWIGFLALFGIASDDGVVLSNCMNKYFAIYNPKNICEIREIVLKAACDRVRPCLMTTATTVIALLPIFTSTGRGADIMRPIALPVFAGMLMALITPIFVPVLYCLLKELKYSISNSGKKPKK